MSHRRTIMRLPLGIPMMDDNKRIHPTWENYFSQANEMIYKYDVYNVTPTNLWNGTNANANSVGANTTSEQTITVPGVASNDFITVNKSTHQTGLGIVNVRASAKDTVAITFMNTTGGGITPDNNTYIIKVEKI